jgi:hypothetical protein
VKGINARTALISLFLGLPVATQAKEYYVYQTPNGARGYLEQAAPAREQNHKEAKPG